MNWWRVVLGPAGRSGCEISRGRSFDSHFLRRSRDSISAHSCQQIIILFFSFSLHSPTTTKLDHHHEEHLFTPHRGTHCRRRRSPQVEIENAFTQAYPQPHQEHKGVTQMKDMMEEYVLHQDKPFCPGMALQEQQDMSFWRRRNKELSTVVTNNGRLTPIFYNVHVQPLFQLVIRFCCRGLWLYRRIWRERPPQRYVYMLPFCTHGGVDRHGPWKYQKGTMIA